MIEAVVFDLDDTLYDYSGLNCAAQNRLCGFACERLRVRREAFLAAYGSAQRDIKALLGDTAACHNRLLYCQKTLELLGQKPAPLALELYEAYWSYMLSHMRLRPGAEELLGYYAEQGLTVGVCTDLTAHIQHRKLSRLSLDRLTDVLVTSEEAGADKPSPLIYRLLLNKLGTEPGRVLFIGDNLEKDVEGPRRMGMRTFWFHDEKTGLPFSTVPVQRLKEIIIER